MFKNWIKPSYYDSRNKTETNVLHMSVFWKKKKRDREREIFHVFQLWGPSMCLSLWSSKVFLQKASPPPPLLASPVICSCSFLFSQNYRDGTFDWSKHHRQTKIVCHGEKISIPETFWERCLACGLQRFSIHEGHLARTIEIEARDMVNNVYQID